MSEPTSQPPDEPTAPTPFSEPGPADPEQFGAPEATPGTGPDPADPGPDPAGPDPADSAPDPATPAAAAPEIGRAPKQTLAGRVWIAIGCAAVLLVVIIIFIAENSRSITISFLGAHGHIALGLALLIAVVAGIGITLLVGSARIVQLSREVRRHRRRLRQLS